MRAAVVVILFILATSATAQFPWQWDALANMPMATANNAVCAAELNGVPHVYSFGGIDTSLTNEGIHRKAFRYDVLNDQWSILPDIPDTLGKIASAASFVNGVIYLMGGYHVFDGPPYELSSDRVHRFDVGSNTWSSDGAPIPVPIDDHVQAVWQDSLIYLITGWSNTTNVPNVQIYDPALDQWTVGTPVPNNSNYKVFGASGVILGDTIYYHGGASVGSNFPAQDEFRKGAIDPNDPSQISWSPVSSSQFGELYRPGAFSAYGAAHWVGGSAVSYNYNAQAYNGSGLVAPLARVVSYQQGGMTLNGDNAAPVMDLRGVGEVHGPVGHGYYVVGGIGLNGEVLSSSHRLVSAVAGIHEEVRVGQVPLHYDGRSGILYLLSGVDHTGAAFEVFDALGRSCANGKVSGVSCDLGTGSISPGLHFLQLFQNGLVIRGRFWSVN